MDTISAGRKQSRPNRNHNANGRPLRDAMNAGMHANPTPTMIQTTKNSAERPFPFVV